MFCHMTGRNEEATSELCLKAFAGELCERGYEGLRMGDVARRAGISRPTLYRHYHSREELFRATIDDIFFAFYEQAEPYFANYDDSFSLAVNYLASAITFRHSALVRALVESRQDDIFMDQLRKYFARLLGAMIRQRPEARVNTVTLGMVTALMAGACYQSLRHWIEHGMQQDPRSISRVMAHVFNGRLVDLLLEEE